MDGFDGTSSAGFDFLRNDGMLPLNRRKLELT
jgi:hypothetical protein